MNLTRPAIFALAPAWLPAVALPCFGRIVAHRLAHGREIYPDAAATIARVIVDAVEAQRAGTATPEAVARARRYAVSVGLLDVRRARLGAIGPDGADIDLARLLEARSMAAPARSRTKRRRDATAAGRMARLRERRAAGLRCDLVEYGEDVIEALVNRGLLMESQRENQAARILALGMALEEWLERPGKEKW